MPVMIQTGARVPVDLVKRATEHARRAEPDAQISGVGGVVRYALALLAGLPHDQAAKELERGYRRQIDQDA